MSKRKPVKKQKKYWLIPFCIVIVIAIYSGVIYYLQQLQERKAGFIMYPGFGIELPSAYSIHGIDVSFYQQYVYWPSVKKMQDDNVRIGFAFIKATEGLSNTDKQFRRNWQKAKESGIARGAYHFFLATKDGKAQAQNFIKNVKLESGDLPPVIDIEQLYGVSPQLMQKRVMDFIHIVEDVYGVQPVIYTNASFYNNYLGEAFDEYPLWVAHYFEQKQPGINRDWLFWQHSCAGKVNGINATVDFNVFNGDSTAFREILVP